MLDTGHLFCIGCMHSSTEAERKTYSFICLFFFMDVSLTKTNLITIAENLCCKHWPQHIRSQQIFVLSAIFISAEKKDQKKKINIIY